MSRTSGSIEPVRLKARTYDQSRFYHYLILELKAAEAIGKAHTAQLINYLKSTKCEVGFVFNFGPEAKFERRYYSKANKKNLKKNP